MIHLSANQKKIDYFRDLQAYWREKNSAEVDNIKRNEKQYYGTKSIDAKTIINEAGEMVSVPCDDADYVRNITYELIEAQVSTFIPQPSVTPKAWSEAHQRNARAAERMLVSMRDELAFEKMNDLEERIVPIHGAAARIIDWDNSYKTHTAVGRVTQRIVDMSYITWQPGIYEVQDMDCIFVRVDTTVDDIVSSYGVTYQRAEDGAEASPDAPTPDDVVSVYTAWYKNEDGRVSKYVWSGNTELEDIENYWSRKRYVCNVCGSRRELCEDEENPGYCRCGGVLTAQDDDYEELTHDIVLSDGRVIPAMSPVMERGVPKTHKVTRPLYDENGVILTATTESGEVVPLTEEVDEVIMTATRLPYYRPDIFPIVIRKNTSKNLSLLGQSDCEYIRDEQQRINRLESIAEKKQQGSGTYPVRPNGSKFIFDKTINTMVLELAPGEHISDYGVIDTTVNNRSDRELSDRAYNHAQRTLGITDSFLGQGDSTAQSGYAKQVQVTQSAGRLSSKRVMKQAAAAEGDEAAFKLALAYADEPRPVTYEDELGEMQRQQFNRYDFYEYDEILGEWYVDDSYSFSTDKGDGENINPVERWEMIAKDYREGLYGTPGSTLALLAVWRDRERAKYPGAHARVSFFRALLKAEAQEGATAKSNNASSDYMNGSATDVPDADAIDVGDN